MRQSVSVFEHLGLTRTIEQKLEEIKMLYAADEMPWVVGYSGGKDSSAALQLIWLALSTLEDSQRRKQVHVISTDTLVENPIVAEWVRASLEKMQKASLDSNLPISVHRLTPKIGNTFWVNLIGRGYPAPRPKFRWCTERLKISPSNDFINSVVRNSGEAVVVLGTRKAESISRSRTMNRLESDRIRDYLSPNASLPNSYVYTPIENWSNDDVWLFLMQIPNPWGQDNKDLLNLYSGASEGGECPLVIDTSSPSCGDSRFGCWVCTLVDKDKSMAAMIQNDQEKEWMLPLLALRDELDVSDDRHLRDFRRMTGRVQIFHDRVIPGPYKQSVREEWLRKLLSIQKWLNDKQSEKLSGLVILTLDEMREIRRIWVIEKHEIEDSLPRIFKKVTGEAFPDDQMDERALIHHRELLLLREICGKDDLLYQLVRDLLDIEKTYKNMARRSGLFDAFEQIFRRNFYADEADATERALRIKNAMESARKGEYQQPTLFEAAGTTNSSGN
jgi:DNA sulfur modification protein DndC